MKNRTAIITAAIAAEKPPEIYHWWQFGGPPYHPLYGFEEKEYYESDPDSDSDNSSADISDNESKAQQVPIANIQKNLLHERYIKANGQLNDIKNYLDFYSNKLMDDPIQVSSGNTYDRATLYSLFQSNNNSQTIVDPQNGELIYKGDLGHRTNLFAKRLTEELVEKQEAKYAEEIKRLAGTLLTSSSENDSEEKQTKTSSHLQFFNSQDFDTNSHKPEKAMVYSANDEGENKKQVEYKQ